MFSEDAILAVKRIFYMDDLLTSKPNPDEATNLAKQLIEILATGGFRLTKWMSNSREVLTAIPSCEVACSTADLDRNVCHKKELWASNGAWNKIRCVCNQ